MYTVELDIEECLKQKPGINAFLSKLRAKPARLEFFKTPWAPLDVISVLAREGESLSTSLAADFDDHSQGDPDLQVRGASNASTTGRRPGECFFFLDWEKSTMRHAKNLSMSYLSHAHFGHATIFVLLSVTSPIGMGPH